MTAPPDPQHGSVDGARHRPDVPDGELDRWWADLTAAALVGTARRPVPAPLHLPLEARADASPEVALLDAAAVGSALRRAGAVPRRLSTGDEPGPAGPDERLPPPARARQLLDLLLTQPPVGARLAPRAIEAWLREAARHGVRAHHATLVPLLQLATRTRELREPLLPVLDRRGAWLAAANPAWRWAVRTADPTAGSVLDPVDGPTSGPVGASTSDAADPISWARLPTDRRAVQLRVLRATEPATARALVESTWQTDPAPAREALLGALEVGLSLDDEPLLERALDDRSAGVREVAWRLLDGLPGSARARRLGELLVPLLSTTGLLRRRVHVELPSRPTPAGVRDGLGKAPPGRSERGLWLQRIAAGAPLEIWTGVTGLDSRTVATTIEDQSAVDGLRAATVARRDATWARALLARDWDPQLVRCLPSEEITSRVLSRLASVTTAPELVSALRLAPAPWPRDVSAAAVGRLASVQRAPHHLPDLLGVLADGLHPDAAPAVARLAATGDGRRDDSLLQLAQYLSFVPTLAEAFS